MPSVGSLNSLALPSNDSCAGGQPWFSYSRGGGVGHSCRSLSEHRDGDAKAAPPRRAPPALGLGVKAGAVHALFTRSRRPLALTVPALHVGRSQQLVRPKVPYSTSIGALAEMLAVAPDVTNTAAARGGTAGAGDRVDWRAHLSFGPGAPGRRGPMLARRTELARWPTIRIPVRSTIGKWRGCASGSGHRLHISRCVPTISKTLVRR